MANVLDVFKGDAFNVIELTDAFNKAPFVPGRAGTILPWNERGVSTTSIMLEEIDGKLVLINPSSRGGPGATIDKQQRKVRTLAVPHYQVDDTIMADEVQGVREFGQEQSVKSIESVINSRFSEHATNFDVTLEYQKLGAIKGIIVNGNGNTLYNLFDEFGVTQEGEVDFDLDNANPAKGALRKKCAGVVRTVMNNLGGMPVMGVHAICGDAFFDDLLSHVEVIASYVGTPMATVLRSGFVYPNDLKVYGAFEFGGIVWENYRGAVNGSAFVDTDKCHLFPMTDRPGLWRTVFAPADYVETVNTIGQPRYAKQILMPNGKGVSLEMQMNALSYCLRPLALMKGKR